MSTPFQPGDCVICVYAGPNHDGGIPADIVEGAVYRVDHCFLHLHSAHMLVALVGNVNFVDETGAYLASRFRKIDDEVTESFRQQMRSLCKKKERAE